MSDIGECRGHRWENGQWTLCGYGDTRDEGRVTLPEEARKRIAEERPGEIAAEGYRYWIKPFRKESEPPRKIFCSEEQRRPVPQLQTKRSTSSRIVVGYIRRDAIAIRKRLD